LLKFSAGYKNNFFFKFSKKNKIPCNILKPKPDNIKLLYYLPNIGKKCEKVRKSFDSINIFL